MRLRSLSSLMAILLILGGCRSETAHDPPGALREPESDRPLHPPGVELIDHSIPPAVAGEDGWNFSRTAETDLDGDGDAERVVLTARVELYQGRPAWDDGQPWQVYVEESDGTRTHLYAQRLQLGTLQLRVTTTDPPIIVLIEHLPDQLAIHEVAYTGPGQFRATTPYIRGVDPRGETAGPELP